MMTVYRFKGADGQLLRFDTDKAECLLETRWEAGRDQSRWIEIYRTQSGKYIQVNRTLWQGEHDSIFEIEESEVLRQLALAEERQLTEAGEQLLAEQDPCREI